MACALGVATALVVALRPDRRPLTLQGAVRKRFRSVSGAARPREFRTKESSTGSTAKARFVAFALDSVLDPRHVRPLGGSDGGRYDQASDRQRLRIYRQRQWKGPVLSHVGCRGLSVRGSA